MARIPDLEIFSKEHDLPILTIKELIDYRFSTEYHVEKIWDLKAKIYTIYRCIKL